MQHSPSQRCGSINISSSRVLLQSSPCPSHELRIDPGASNTCSSIYLLPSDRRSAALLDIYCSPPPIIIYLLSSPPRLCSTHDRSPDMSLTPAQQQEILALVKPTLGAILLGLVFSST